MEEVRFADTTLRDGPLSLWASTVRARWIEPVAADLDRAGFISAEIVAPSIEKFVRELREDPLDLVRRIARHMPVTPLRVILSRYMASFQVTPAALMELWLDRVAAHGARQARISDPSNTVANLARTVATARRHGVEPVVNLIYSLSPKHTDAYYAERARGIAALDVPAICIKDPGGLLTPERTATLVPAVLEAAGGRTVEFHTHCTTGLGPLCCLEAVRRGIRVVHAAVPPLANGSSNPSVFNLAANLRTLGYEPVVDREALRPVSAHLTAVARRAGLPVGVPAPYDVSYYAHQVPGGMISNLRFQLGRLGMAGRLPQVLEEIARVRQELGHPIMVTPYSQFVGTQAMMNVATGERYREVTDQVIQYALGIWGDEERDGIEREVRARILDRPRARALERWEPPEPSLRDIRRQAGPGISDDDLILGWVVGQQAVARMRAEPPADEAFGAGQALVDLLSALACRTDVRSVHVVKGGVSLRVGGGAEAVGEGRRV